MFSSGVLSTKKGVAALSIASNSLLVLLKLAVGLTIGSVSVLSEALHSGIDLLAAVMAFFAVRSSAQPPDDRHTFGHGKVESLSGFVEAILIFVAAILIVTEAARKMAEGTHLETVDLGIGVMVVSALVNTLVSRKLLKVAKATDSVALEADGWHLTTDVLTSAGVALGLVAVRLTGVSALDPLIAIGVAIFICKAAYDITRRSLMDLLDTSLPQEEQSQILAALDEHKGELVGYHRVRSRKAGGQRHVDFHLVVRRDATVQQSHNLCNHLERHLRSSLGPRASLNIHVEPCRGRCEQCRLDCSPATQAG